MGRESEVPGEDPTGRKTPELPAGRWRWGLEEGRGSGGHKGHWTCGGDEMASPKRLPLREEGWGYKGS